MTTCLAFWYMCVQLAVRLRCHGNALFSHHCLLLLLLLLVRLHDLSSSSDEVGGLLQVLQNAQTALSSLWHGFITRRQYVRYMIIKSQGRTDGSPLGFFCSSHIKDRINASISANETWMSYWHKVSDQMLLINRFRQSPSNFTWGHHMYRSNLSL